MDPLSIIAAVTGILGVGLHTAHRLQNLLASVKDAPSDVRTAAHDIDVLSETLSTLQKYLEDRIITAEAAKQLSTCIKDCTTAMEQLEKKILPYLKSVGDGKMTKWKSLRWAFDQGDIQGSKDKLQHYKNSLTLSVNMVNTLAIKTGTIQTLQRIDSGNKMLVNRIDTSDRVVTGRIDSNSVALQKRITELGLQIRADANDKVDLASAKGRRGSDSGRTDVGLPLRRYLENLPPLDHPWAAATEVGDILTLDGNSPSDEVADDDHDSVASLAELKVLNVPKGSTPSRFHQAVWAGDETVVTGILDDNTEKVDVNEKARDGWTALHLCADTDNVAVAKLLVDRNANIGARDKKRRLPFTVALEARSKNVACLLLDRGSCLDEFAEHASDSLEVQQDEVDKEFLDSLARHINEGSKMDGKTTGMLHKAVDLEQNELIRLLLRNGFDPNEVDKKGFVPLHYAAFDHKITTIELLLEYGADIHATAARGTRTDPDAGGLASTALAIAAGRGDEEAMKLLIQHGADVNAIDLSGGNPLQAVAIHPVSTALILIDSGADIFNQKHDGYTIFHWAAACNNPQLISFLLSRGADIDAQTVEGDTALHIAALNARLAAVKLLIEKGASVNYGDLFKRTPLHDAVYSGDSDTVACIVQAGAWISRDHTNETPLMIAQRLGYDHIVQYFESLQGEQRNVDDEGFEEEREEEEELGRKIEDGGEREEDTTGDGQEGVQGSAQGKDAAGLAELKPWSSDKHRSDSRENVGDWKDIKKHIIRTSTF